MTTLFFVAAIALLIVCGYRLMGVLDRFLSDWNGCCRKSPGQGLNSLFHS